MESDQRSINQKNESSMNEQLQSLLMELSEILGVHVNLADIMAINSSVSVKVRLEVSWLKTIPVWDHQIIEAKDEVEMILKVADQINKLKQAA